MGKHLALMLEAISYKHLEKGLSTVSSTEVLRCSIRYFYCWDVAGGGHLPLH